MSTSHRLTIGAVAVLLLAGVAYLWTNRGTSDGGITDPSGQAFLKTGYLLINQTGLQPDTWYLANEVGQPTGSAELQFTDTSACIWYSDASQPCDSLLFHNGDRVTVSGEQKGNIVTVNRLSFNEPQPPERDIQLFYYNEKRDRELSGNDNLLCSSEAVLPVNRRLPVSKTPIQDTIKLLLQGHLSAQERALGFRTEFPVAGMQVEGANLQNGVLTLAFSDSQNRTTGGACRVSLLWEQIRKTALQFPQVKEVRFMPDEMFQP
jgi:hypothetical protein